MKSIYEIFWLNWKPVKKTCMNRQRLVRATTTLHSSGFEGYVLAGCQLPSTLKGFISWYWNMVAEVRERVWRNRSAFRRPTKRRVENLKINTFERVTKLHRASPWLTSSKSSRGLSVPSSTSTPRRWTTWPSSSSTSGQSGVSYIFSFRLLFFQKS